MKKIICFLMLIVLSLIPASCAAEPDTPLDIYPHVQPDYEAYKDTLVMHIGAWIAPPPGNCFSGITNDNFITQERYNEVAESGINTIYGLYEARGNYAGNNLQSQIAIKNALTYAANAGIKYLVPGTGSVANYINEYKFYPAFKGFLVKDEPSGEEIEVYAADKELYEERFPNSLYYINLLPNYATTSQLSNLTYEEYVDKYLTMVKPEFISYDFYPLLYSGTKSYILQGYLANCEIMAVKAKEHGIPVWGFFQSMGYGNKRAPDEQDFRFQAYVNLAYGVKGMQHFCYWTPMTNDGGKFNETTTAMISRTGEKTERYYYAQTINNEMLSFDHVFLNFTWETTMTLLGKDSEENGDFNLLKHTVSVYPRIKSAEAERDAIIGILKDNNGYEGFMVVNYNDPGLKQGNKVKVSFYHATKLLMYTKGVPSVVDLIDGTYEFDLENGEGRFIIPF